MHSQRRLYLLTSTHVSLSVTCFLLQTSTFYRVIIQMGFLSLNRREENVHTTSRFNLISTAGFFFCFFSTRQGTISGAWLITKLDRKGGRGGKRFGKLSDRLTRGSGEAYWQLDGQRVPLISLIGRGADVSCNVYWRWLPQKFMIVRF